MNDQQTILCLPSRVHHEDIACEIVLDDHDYQHLHMPNDEASTDWFEKTFRDRLITVTSKIYGENNMIATLVATNGNWGAYVATQEMLEKKEQPLFLAPYERPSEAVEAIEEQLPNQFLGFTDYGSFWEQIVYAGIEKPETMPHREPYTKEDWQRGRVRTCNQCKKAIV